MTDYKEETRREKAKEALVEKLVHGNAEYVTGNQLRPRRPGAIIQGLSAEEREVCKTLTAKDFGFEKNRIAHWTAQVWRDQTRRWK